MPVCGDIKLGEMENIPYFLAVPVYVDTNIRSLDMLLQGAFLLYIQDNKIISNEAAALVCGHRDI